MISLLGLFLMGLPYLYGVAFGAARRAGGDGRLVTLLPALLGFAGRKIDRLRIPGPRNAARRPDRRPAARWSRGVQRRPWAAAIAAAAVLLVLATPFLGAAPRLPRRRQRPDATTTRQAYDLVSQGLRRRRQRPARCSPPTARPDDRGRSSTALASRLREAARASPPSAGRGQPRRATPPCSSSTPATSPQATATGDLIRRLRDDVLPERRDAGQRRRHHGLVRRPGRRHPTGCRCSSAASSSSRSCC